MQRGGSGTGYGVKKGFLWPECEVGIKSIASAQLEEEVNDVRSWGSIFHQAW